MLLAIPNCLIKNMLLPHPANCSDPTAPTNGSIEAYQNTTEGAEIFFMCNEGLVPAGRMTAVCGADGRWNPDPATTMCTCKSTYSVEKECLILFFSCVYIAVGRHLSELQISKHIV